MSGDGEYLIPWKGRNPSGAFSQNFVWKTGTVYVMDNHRAALWCWMQHLKPREHHSIYHIDRHYDTLQSRMSQWVQHLPSDWKDLGLEQYLKIPVDLEDNLRCPVFSWGNYLSLHLEQAKGQILAGYFATHNDGDLPNLQKRQDVEPWELLSNLDYVICDRAPPWILNVDLDYFFCDASDGYVQMNSDEYIGAVFKSARVAIDSGNVAVTTIALSPEFCGGWERSEHVLSISMRALGINFRLPE